MSAAMARIGEGTTASVCEIVVAAFSPHFRLQRRRVEGLQLRPMQAPAGGIAGIRAWLLTLGYLIVRLFRIGTRGRGTQRIRPAGHRFIHGAITGAVVACTPPAI